MMLPECYQRFLVMITDFVLFFRYNIYKACCLPQYLEKML